MKSVTYRKMKAVRFRMTKITHNNRRLPEVNTIPGVVREPWYIK